MPACRRCANRDDVFGEQYVVDETGDFVRLNERLLLVSSSAIRNGGRSGRMRRGWLRYRGPRRSASLQSARPIWVSFPATWPLAALEISRADTAGARSVARFPSLQGGRWSLRAMPTG